MMQILDRWKWPLTVVVSVALVAFAAVTLAGPSLGVDAEALAEVRRWAAGIGSAAASMLLPLLARDADRDGSPALLDANDNDPEVQ